MTICFQWLVHWSSSIHTGLLGFPGHTLLLESEDTMSPSPSCHHNVIAQLPPAAGDSCPAQTSAQAVCAWGASPPPLSPAFQAARTCFTISSSGLRLLEPCQGSQRAPPTRLSLHSTATAKTPRPSPLHLAPAKGPLPLHSKDRGLEARICSHPSHCQSCPAPTPSSPG